LNLLVETGKIDKTYKVSCVIQTASNDIERAAIKLLANDGQALTPYEWAAEVVRLSEAGNEVSEIAKVLGKSVGYVNSLLNTWSALTDDAKKQVVSGKVSMSLAIAMKKESANDKLVSLGVQVAAAAKDVVNQNGEHVSDKVLAAAVSKTTDNIVKAASEGKSLSGSQIGADVLANIQLVKQTHKQASQAAKDVLEGIVAPKQNKSLESFIEGLIEAMNEDKRLKLVAPFLNEVLLCFEQRMDVKESMESIYKLNKTVTV